MLLQMQDNYISMELHWQQAARKRATHDLTICFYVRRPEAATAREAPYLARHKLQKRNQKAEKLMRSYRLRLNNNTQQQLIQVTIQFIISFVTHIKHYKDCPLLCVTHD